MRKEITAEETRMQQGIRDEYLAAVQRENLLTTAFEQQKQQANQLNESAIEYSVLKRDAETNRQLYQDLLQRLKEAGVSAGLRSSNIRVVDVARTPTSPIKPNVPRNLRARPSARPCLRYWTCIRAGESGHQHQEYGRA